MLVLLLAVDVGWHEDDEVVEDVDSVAADVDFVVVIVTRHVGGIVKPVTPNNEAGFGTIFGLALMKFLLELDADADADVTETETIEYWV